MNIRNSITPLAIAAGAGMLLRSVIRRLGEFDLRDRVVLITGGSRGLGLLMAREFGREGARLAICARDADELDRAREDLSARGVESLPIACDVTRNESVTEMVAQVIDCYGRIDVLVNNAGVIEVGPMEVMNLSDFQTAMNTHFWGPVYTTFSVLPHMRKRRQGRIVNITSIGGRVSVPHLLPYCSSKFALVGFSEGLRAELLKDGIRVTTVSPGLMRTGSARNAEFKGRHRAEYALFSLSAALPITSMKGERAARQIVTACKRGHAELTLTIQAQLAARFHGLWPGLTADLLGALNAVLPGPNGAGDKKLKGSESESWLAPSILTVLNDNAAVTNNEVA